MRRMSNQCCPSSRPSMQNGQTRPLEKKRSFCASFHTPSAANLAGLRTVVLLVPPSEGYVLGESSSQSVRSRRQPGQTSTGGLPTRFANPDCCHTRYRRRPRPRGSVPDALVASSLWPVHTWSENRRYQEYPLFRNEAGLPASDEEDRVRGRAACGQGC